MHDPKDAPTSDQPKEYAMLPAWLLLAAKLAIELRPFATALLKRFLSK
ncbi:MAG: hypothetical protein NT123_24445 [Proteobacteria bacterium]|nr:hypothetical protein [Pseudomonadota bacterium]